MIVLRFIRFMILLAFWSTISVGVAVIAASLLWFVLVIEPWRTTH